MLAGEAGVLPVVASVVSGRPVGVSSLTLASRGRLATPSGTSRPRCSDGGRVVAAVVKARVWVGQGGAGGDFVDLFSAVYFSVIMQRQFPAVLCPRFSSSTVVGYSCAETGTHSANCAADRRDSSGAALGPVLDMPVVQRGAQFACQGRRHLCRGADADSFDHRDCTVAVH